MQRRGSTVTQLDLTRVLKGAIKAGFKPGRVVIEPDGRIIILNEDAAPKAPTASSESPNEWDQK
jgi:hypothetical protein